MKIRVKTKKEFAEKVREYRTKGFMIITFFTGEFAELEKDSKIVIIER